MINVLKQKIKKFLIKVGLFKIVIILLQQFLLFMFNSMAFFIYLFLCFLKILGKRVVLCGVSSDRIGAIAYHMELFLRSLKKNANLLKKNNYVLACLYVPVANQHLVNMYRRKTSIIENKLLGKILQYSWLKETKFYQYLGDQDKENYEFNYMRPILSFTDEENELGRKLLKEMGISEKDWFICFHSRDSKYETRHQGSSISQRNDFRDSSIENYLPAAEYIANKGGFAIRMGAIIDRPLPKLRNPRIIDYASDYRSDFMDIYLSAHCKFFLGNTSGIFVVSTIFGVPVACANFIPIDVVPYTSKDLFIPKKIFDIKRNCFLTFEEIFNSDIVHFCLSEHYQSGLEVVENSPDEILELTKEMNLRLDHEYSDNAETEELKRKFQSLIKSTHYSYDFSAKISGEFLRKHKDTLF